MIAHVNRFDRDGTGLALGLRTLSLRAGVHLMLEESGGGGDSTSGDDQPDAQTQQPQCETFWRGRRLGIFRFSVSVMTTHYL